MRYIRLRESCAPKDAGGNDNQAWLDKAQNLLDQLTGAADHAARCAIIDANEDVWRELRDWLLSLSHEKCWYSEAKDVFSYVDVEHYRPKTKVKRKKRGPEKDGYWWLAFAWQNYRICGQVGNRRKGIFFPLSDTSPEATYGGLSIQNEVPLLLDPAKDGDPALLTFNEDGSVESLPDADVLSKTRVVETVERLNLNYPRLKKARQRVWSRCRRIVEECRDIAADGPQAIGPAELAQLQLKKAELRSMIAENAEFSAVAISCLLKSNIGWAMQIACGV
jgi:uncharacterized protein (TIGR02646 family)